MKALFVGSDPHLFNPESAAYARIRSYADAIGEVHVLMRSIRPDETVVDGPLTIHGVRAGALDISLLVTKARALIAEHGIEVVSAQDPFEHGWIAKEAVKGTNAKLHIQVHTDFLSPWFVRGGMTRSPQVSVPVKNRVRRLLADRVLPSADGVRVVSERVKASIVARYGTKVPEPFVLPIAVSAEVPPAAPLPRHGFPFAFVTVARLEPEKRIEDSIEALARIAATEPTIGLVIIGDGSEKPRLMELVVKMQLMGRVVFAGAQPPEIAWGMVRSAQGYIQASAYEGYSRTLLEAALARVPIITTDVGIVGEVFAGYEDVLSAPPGDPAQLALHMLALIEDVSARERMIRSAEQKALAHLAPYQHLPELIARDLSRLLPGSNPV
jgi:glycosyltransferase involved in cell wall biosynthesis